MQYRACSQTDEQRDEHRLHYCGTCKTMGALYGQSSRFLLNNDAVFLAELLSAVAPAQQSPSDWTTAYQSYNCMTLPVEIFRLPLSLRIAADVTMLLTEMKIDDHIVDSGNMSWNVARKFYSERCRQATQSLEAFNFPVSQIWEHYREQAVRESFATLHADYFSSLHLVDYCAVPTGKITALVFESAVRSVGCEDPATSYAMQQIGDSFGRLIYLLDAVEDYAQDLRRKQFNPLSLAYKLDSTILTDHCRNHLMPYVRARVRHIERYFRVLPMEGNVAEGFCRRLRDNVTEKLGPGWSSCASSCHHHHPAVASAGNQFGRGPKRSANLTFDRTARATCGNAPITWAQRWSFACEQPVKLVPTSMHSARRLVSNVAVFLIAWMFPVYSRQCKSMPQMMSIPMNLIAWGTLINELMRFPSRLVPAFAAMDSGASGSGAGGAGSGGGDGGYVYGTGYGSSSASGGEHKHSSGGDSGYSGSEKSGESGQPGRSEGEPEPESDRPKRSRKPFGEPHPDEPTPELKPGPDESKRIRPPAKSSWRSGRASGSGSSGYSPTYPDSPYRPYRSGSGCCTNCCANLTCNLCGECACESCQCCDICGSTDCCACGGGDCCGAGGGADCCGGAGGGDCCGGSADCCGSADCGSCDCGGADCSGCNGCG